MRRILILRDRQSGRLRNPAPPQTKNQATLFPILPELAWHFRRSGDARPARRQSDTVAVEFVAQELYAVKMKFMLAVHDCVEGEQFVLAIVAIRGGVVVSRLVRTSAARCVQCDSP